MESIYKNKMAVIEKYNDTLRAIEVKNTKEDGKTPYDVGVLFDMLRADQKAIAGDQELPYPFEGSDEFDWAQFAKELEAL